MSAGNDSRIAELLKKKETLWERLQKGRETIRTAQERGSERADYYFEFWLTLLTDYEQTIDQLRSLGVAEELLMKGRSAPATL
ncbi:MAG: hypothetical protein ACUVWR_16980 [Anaerolineae bacterium]